MLNGMSGFVATGWDGIDGIDSGWFFLLLCEACYSCLGDGKHSIFLLSVFYYGGLSSADGTELYVWSLAFCVLQFSSWVGDLVFFR